MIVWIYMLIYAYFKKKANVSEKEIIWLLNKYTKFFIQKTNIKRYKNICTGNCIQKVTNNYIWNYCIITNG